MGRLSKSVFDVLSNVQAQCKEPLPCVLTRIEKTFLTDRPSYLGEWRHPPTKHSERGSTLQNPMPFGHPPYSPPNAGSGQAGARPVPFLHA
jgi:hypothetical protein